MLSGLQQKHNDQKTLKQNAIDEKILCENKMKLAEARLKEKEVYCNQKETQIELLIKEKDQLQEQVKEKEHELYKYKFKIKDLQKSKHVLTHRAKGIHASLEPKEKQIESLKEQILNLEKVFEHQMKTMNEREDELTKKQSKISQLTHEFNSQKAKTKDKEKLVFRIVADINRYVQSKDEKSYVNGLMQLNQDYVMPRSNEFKQKKKKDPESVEELDRQLRYMERSIATIKVNTIKNETRTKNDIKKRTKENTQLIRDLNEIRVDKNRLLAQIDTLKQEIVELKFKMDKKDRTEKSEIVSLAYTLLEESELVDGTKFSGRG